jgi:urea transport system permease protein
MPAPRHRDPRPLAESPIPPTEQECRDAIGTQIFGVVGVGIPVDLGLCRQPVSQLMMVVLVPGLLALVFGWLAFRSRVTGVYLSILTQAMTLALSLYLFQNDSGLRGNNGLSGLQNIPGAEAIAAGPCSRSGSSGPRRWRWAGLYLRAWVVSGKFGSVIRGIRDDEARVRFLGYPVEGYKLVVFTLTAVICGHRRRALLSRRRASSTRPRSRPSPRSTWPSGSPSAGAGGSMAR